MNYWIKLEGSEATIGFVGHGSEISYPVQVVCRRVMAYPSIANALVMVAEELQTSLKDHAEESWAKRVLEELGKAVL